MTAREGTASLALATAFALLSSAAAATPALAQDPSVGTGDSWEGDADASVAAVNGSPRSAVVIAPTIGVLTPLSDLIPGAGAGSSVELSTAIAFGGTASLWFGEFGIGVQGLYAAPEVTVQTTDPTTGFPEVEAFGGATFLAGTATLRYRPDLGALREVLMPYLALGGGLRRVDPGDDAAASPGAVSAGLEESTDPVGTAALGALVRLGRRLGVHIEVRDFVSTYDPAGPEGGSVQNDLVLSLGLGLRLP